MQLTQTKTIIDFFKAAIDLDRELDFALFPKEPVVSSESVTIGGITIPKLGSLTVGESILWDELISAIDMDKTMMATIYKVVSGIVLKGRCTADYSLLNIIKLPQDTAEGIYNFFTSERDGGKVEPDSAPAEETQPVVKTGNGSSPAKSGTALSGDSNTATPVIVDSITAPLVAA